MFNWRDVLIEEERRKETLRRAEQERLVRSLLPNRTVRAPLHHVALARLGGWLETLGCRLRARYGALGETTGLPMTGTTMNQRC